MKRQRSLITHHVYFGVDAQRLHEASGRVLARVQGLPPERARVTSRHLRQDFGVDTVTGRTLVDGMVAEGLLQPRAEGQDDFFLTERFVEIASARVVAPLARAHARTIVGTASELATRINAESPRNPLAVEAVAVFGAYMSLDEELGDLDLALLVRARRPVRRLRWRPMLSRSDGASEIRHAFRALGSSVRVQLVTDLHLVPRPFAVVFEDR